MSDEIELKLAVDTHFADFLSRAMSAFRVKAQDSLYYLGNIYYDTADGFFAKQKMGLRVRVENDAFMLTLKTQGESRGGLHIRPEYHVSLQGPQPTADELKKMAKLTALLEAEAVGPLLPVFSTDFQRRLWLVELANGAEVEVALDQGEILAQGRREPISEVEFELKQGQLEDLLHFVEELSLTDGVRLFSLSKAQRGYALAKKAPKPATDWIAAWRKLLDAEPQRENSCQKLTALFRFEQDLIEDTMRLDVAQTAQDFVKTVERVGAFFNLYFHYVEQAGLLDSAFAEQQDSALDPEIPTRLAESNSRLLEQVKALIVEHSSQKDNHSVLLKLQDMLRRAAYVNRLLRLIRLTRPAGGKAHG